MSSDFEFSQAFAGVTPVSGVARWRVLRLAESVEVGAWRQNTSPARVLTATQDASGWITLDANNPSPAVSYPEDYAFLTWRLKDVFGRTSDVGLFDGAATGALQVVIERDDNTWAGGYGETVGVGVADRAGDLSHASVQILGVGINTPNGDSAQVAVAGIKGAANASTTLNFKWLVGVFTILPAQFINVTAGAVDTDKSAVGGALKENTPAPCSGERRLWLGFGASTDTDEGSIPVKFRAHYRILPAGDLP